MVTAVTESGRPLQEAATGSGRRRPLQKADGRYRKRPLKAAVTGSRRPLKWRPLHKQCPDAGAPSTSATVIRGRPLGTAGSEKANWDNAS